MGRMRKRLRRPMSEAPVRRIAVPATVLTLIFAVVRGGAAQAAPAAVPAPVSSVAWGPCDPAEEAPEQVLCGTLEVPVDWRRPDGPTFELALAKHPAADPSRRIGSLLINPGGPGGSGVSFAFGAAESFSPEVVDRFDIVGFDPRGQAR